MKSKILLSFVLLFGLLVSTGVCLAAPADGNALAAVALYIDTGGRYVPGVDILNKALNEVIRYKINMLFLGSEVQSGNEVLRDLRRYDVNTAAEATPGTLSSYAANRHVNYIILLSVRPLDIALDVKAFSAVDNCYIVDKTVTRPDGASALTTVEALSELIGEEVVTLLQYIRGT